MDLPWATQGPALGWALMRSAAPAEGLSDTDKENTNKCTGSDTVLLLLGGATPMLRLRSANGRPAATCTAPGVQCYSLSRVLTAVPVHNPGEPTKGLEHLSIA